MIHDTSTDGCTWASESTSTAVSIRRSKQQRPQMCEDKSAFQHKTPDHSGEQTVHEIESRTSCSVNGWSCSTASALESPQTTCQNQQRCLTLLGPRSFRIASVNSVHSGAFETLREITDDFQVSNNTPFTSVRSQSTSEQNCATRVSPLEETRVWARGEKKHSFTSDVVQHRSSLACQSSST